MASSDALQATVEAAATRLAADLAAAEAWTAHWSDARRGCLAVEAALTRCLERLAATGCWGEANRLPSQHLWRIAGPWLQRGDMLTHARFKPFGYAGDHQMLSRIWRRWCCDDPLGRALDDYFQRQAAPEAVRARTEQIAARLLVDCLEHVGPYRVVSVGSGPALDVAEALTALPSPRRAAVEVRLLDLDPQALECAQANVEPLLPSDQLTLIRTNLMRLPQQADADATLGDANFLICSGFFDYLDDAAAVAMLELFWQRLAAGGRMVVGNFAPHNPTRAFMEWIGNWYLRYRQPEPFQRLALAAGIPQAQSTVGADRTGVDLLLEAWKP